MSRRPFTTYHIKAPHAESYKLIQHIRFLINEKALKMIGHEGSEDGYTYANLYLKPKISLKMHEKAMKHLDSLGLKAI